MMIMVLCLLQVFPNARIINEYGPTEGNACTHHIFAPSDEFVVIGKPDINTHGYVVDRSMRMVPIGAPGELLLSGPKLALGYANRPDLTAEKFIPNPCLSDVEDLLPEDMVRYYRFAYRTGDLVRWRPGGTLEYLGRIDRQVKVNGVRIELGEVETVLAAADNVESAVVSAVKDPKGKYRLVGYVTPKNVDVGECMAHCREHLVASMVPSIVLAMETFPLTLNGKVDIKALPVPDWEGDKDEEYVGPADHEEEVIQSTFAEVLKRPPEELSVVADFFANGGTSLQVFRVTAALQKSFGISLPSNLLHSARHARAVASEVKKLLNSENKVEVEGLLPRTWSDNARPLSLSQEVYLRFSKLRGEGANNMPIVVQIDGRLSHMHLEYALNQLAARHDVLRMYYVEDESERPYAMLLSSDSFKSHLKISSLKRKDLDDAVFKEMGRPFDLYTGPLFRCTVMECEDDPNFSVVILNLHHTIGDGWSMSIAVKELSEAYNASLENRSPRFDPPALQIQFFDYAAWQNDYLNSGGLKKRMEFWHSIFADLPAEPAIVLDHPRTESFQGWAGALRGRLEPELTTALRNFANSNQLTMQSLFLCACTVRFDSCPLQYSISSLRLRMYYSFAVADHIFVPKGLST